MKRSTTKVNELAEHILKSKYYMHGEKSPEDVFYRVARVAAIPDVIDQFVNLHNAVPPALRKAFDPYSAEFQRVVKRRGISVNSKSKKDIDKIGQIWDEHTYKYYEQLSDLKLMPGTPTLINSGSAIGMLSSCFFLNVADSMDHIFDTVKKTALIAKAGGGVGLNISDLRPKGAKIKGTNGTSSGPISFLKVFDITGHQVKQGGIRRAAMMAAMRVTHPDIVQFIRCKAIEKSFSNFNMSVLITDDFMYRIENTPNVPFVCIFDEEEYLIQKEDDLGVLVSEYAGKTEVYTYQEVWNLIISSAWKNGEPGVIFHDTLNAGDPFQGRYGKLYTNPCSEIGLNDGESCNLAAINLNPFFNRETGLLDTEELKKTVQLGVRMLDNIIDLNNYPLEEIETATLRSRKIGLGIMGFHDLLLASGLPYKASISVCSIIDQLYGIIGTTANAASEELGKLRGIPPAIRDYTTLNRRNANLLSVQPTGTVSIICNQASSAIEPVYRWEYTRTDSYGVHQIRHWIRDIFPDDLPEYAKNSVEVSPEDHVAIQAKVQSKIDQLISKTCILPNKATEEDVENIFQAAFKSKCKSITVYRDGSREDEVLSAGDKRTVGKISVLRDRPRVLYGATYRINTPGGKAYITINEDRDGIREVFLHISKAGSEIQTHIEAEGRLISNSLKYRMPVSAIIDHLVDHKSNPIFDSGALVKSVPDAVAQVMKEFQENLEGFSEYLEVNPMVPSIYADDKINKLTEKTGDLCPECGEILYRNDKCPVCISCGYSQCN